MAGVPLRREGVFFERCREAGPPAPRGELVRRAEEWFTRHDIHVDTGLLIVPVGVVKGRLRAALLGDTVLLRGSLPVNHRELRYYRNIVNPALYTAHMFRTFWERRGLVLKGNVREGRVPASARQILEFESLPLWQVVWGLNKFSNNFVGDQIMKKNRS